MLPTDIDNGTSSAAQVENPSEEQESTDLVIVEETLQVNENIEPSTSKSSKKDMDKTLGAFMSMINKQCSSNKESAAQANNLMNFLLEKGSEMDKAAKYNTSDPYEAKKFAEELKAAVGKGTTQFIGQVLDKFGCNMPAFEWCKKEKDEMQRRCNLLERKLKETQEEMKKYKKISMEVIEKKNEEIHRLENGQVLMKKDEEIEELKQGHLKILQEKIQFLEDTKHEVKDLEKNLTNLKSEKEKFHVSYSKLIQKKDEDLEKLSKEKHLLEEKATKTDDLEKTVNELHREVTKKNEENEKLKQANLKLIKGKEEEIDKMRKHQTQEIKEKKKEVDHLKVENLQLSTQKNNLISRIMQKEEAEGQLKGENKKLVDKVRTLEQSMTRLEKSAENDQLKMAMKLNMLETEIKEKNRLISENQKSRQRDVSENDKAIKELQSKNLSSSESGTESEASGKMPVRLHNRLTSSEASSRLQKPYVAPNKFGYTLRYVQYKKDILDVDSLLKQATEMREKLISLTDREEIRKLAEREYELYEGRLKKYERAIEMNIQLLEGRENVGFAIPIPDFPSISSHFTAEYWSAIREHDKENQKHAIHL